MTAEDTVRGLMARTTEEALADPRLRSILNGQMPPMKCKRSSTASSSPTSTPSRYWHSSHPSRRRR